MPNEKAFELIDNSSHESPDFDPEKASALISRNYCEPGEALYKRGQTLKNDPFKAIKEVELLGINEKEITDPITGLIIAAAKLDTARKELDLSPKQVKIFDGLKENINGAIAWAGTNKLLRKTLISAQVISLTLSSAGCINATISPVEASSTSSTVEVATANPIMSVDIPTTSLNTPKPTDLFTITPTITPTEAFTISGIEVASYPTTSENLITTPSISGDKAEKIIVDLGAGNDLDLLKNIYRKGGLQDSTFEPIVIEAGAK